MNKEQTELERKVIDFYCKKCRKSLGIRYTLSGDSDSLVLSGIAMKCRTNKCNRVLTFKSVTERTLTTMADRNGRVFI